MRSGRAARRSRATGCDRNFRTTTWKMGAAGKLVLESLGVHHLALVTGVSLGGRTTWQWAVQYPDFMDALVPMISSPQPNAGRRGGIDFLAEAIGGTDPG